jgi:hypothetical protein
MERGHEQVATDGHLWCELFASEMEAGWWRHLAATVYDDSAPKRRTPNQDCGEINGRRFIVTRGGSGTNGDAL